MDHFCKVVLDGLAVPVSALDAASVQAISNLALQSYRAGKPLNYRSVNPVRLGFVGCGKFGKFMTTVVDRIPASLQLATKPLTQTGGQTWETFLQAVEAAYVCSPDRLHAEHALKCLQAGRHVLVEKPVLGFDDVAQAALSVRRVLMVGFHRRFHEDFVQARAAVCGLAAGSRLEIRSLDPFPAEDDNDFVLCNSLVHDLDMARWLMEPRAIGVLSLTNQARHNVFDITLVSKETDGCAPTTIHIHYRKDHPSCKPSNFVRVLAIGI